MKSLSNGRAKRCATSMAKRRNHTGGLTLPACRGVFVIMIPGLFSLVFFEVLDNFPDQLPENVGI